MNNRGQAILSEYVMAFFVVIAAAVAMTTFVQRALQGRVHDARTYMIDSVITSGACDAQCLKATGGNQIGYEYEPYYAQTGANVQYGQTENSGSTTGNSEALGAIYLKSLNEGTQTNSFSNQCPPEAAPGGC